ncbi:hypothetical protein [Streptomyces clavuligerus]|nr:hypothetical protein [Streptomyces clavuligerus]
MAYATDETIRELYRLHSGYLLRTLLKVTKGTGAAPRTSSRRR